MHNAINLIEYIKTMQSNYGIGDPARNRSRIREAIKRNINSENLSDHQRDNGIASLESLKIRRVRRKIIGIRFQKCLIEDDPSFLMESLNMSDYRFIRSNGEWVDIINDKFSSEISACEDCNALEFNHDGTWAYDGDRFICSHCCDHYYHYSDRRETYVHDDDEDNEEDNDIIGEYHSSSERLGLIPSEHDQTKNPIYLGIELEMESNGSRDRYERAETLINAIGNHKGHTYCLLENDSSLNDGFEMVSGHTSLAVHRDQLSFFKNQFAGMKSHDTRTCGLHIHICKKGMNMNHAAKLILFINDSGNQRLVKAIARRDGSSFAQVKNKKASYNWLKSARQNSGIRNQLMYLNDDRYEALNFKNPNTIEFRLFKGTLRYETIIACLEFTFASWYFAKDSGINDLTTDNFLKYICKPENRADTKFLREYLKQKNFDLPSLGIVKKNPRSESTALELAEI
jgi:hypothetical protein